MAVKLDCGYSDRDLAVFVLGTHWLIVCTAPVVDQSRSKGRKEEVYASWTTQETGTVVVARHHL